MKKDKNEYMQKILLLLLCVAFSFVFYEKTIAIENVNYGIEELHQYNQELYRNNIGLMENGVSPRYFANVTVSLLMNLLKMSWANVATLLIRFNFVLYAIAVAKTVCNMTNKRLMFGLVLISCVFRTSLGSLAGFGLNGALDAFIGTGTALVLLAISYLAGEKKNWMAAWIFLALATLMHVHEGMWGGCVVGLLWLAGAIANKKINWKALKGLPIYVVVMLLVTVPSLMHGEAVDEGLFAEIYVNIRTPNHLLPTVWGVDTIIKCFVLILIPAVFLGIKLLKNKEDSEYKQMLTASVLSIVLWVGILALEYYATVINPNSTIITMYMPKCFKYIVYIAMLIYLRIADRSYDEKMYLQATCALIVLILGADYSFAVSAAVAVVLILECIFGLENKFLVKEAPFYYETIKIISWVFLMAAICLMHGWNSTIFMIVAIIIVVEFILPFLRQRNIGNVALCVIAVFVIVVSLQDKMYWFYEDKLQAISGDLCLRNAMGNDYYFLSLTFKDATDTDDAFLADPYDPKAGWVQLMSERNCYALFKCTPSSKKAVIEWYDRIEQVENLPNMTAEEIAQLMEDIDIQYVLINPGQYEIMDQSELFEQIVQNECAAMYKLK